MSGRSNPDSDASHAISVNHILRVRLVPSIRDSACGGLAMTNSANIIFYIMQDKDLFKQLNALKSIKPDRAWKERNRELLFKQIAGDLPSENKLTFAQILESYIFAPAIKVFSQPVWTAAIIALLALAGGTASIFASRNAKPGDSLYIAKIISEKAQMTLTFNEKEKAKLNIEFAGNRAKELSQVINENKNETVKNEKIEQLSNDFKKEIASAKSKLRNINSIVAAKKNITANNQSAAAVSGEQNEDNQIFGANSGKSEQGMDVAEQSGAPNAASIKDEKKTADAAEKSFEIKAGVLGKTLDEAEKLFDSKNFSGTLDKLTEANGIIDNGGEVKSGETENGGTATSSGEVLGAVEKNDIE